MCDSKVKGLFDKLSSIIDKERIESVNELYQIYQKNAESREYIINRLIKGLTTVRQPPRKGFCNTFHHIVQSLDAASFESTINKMKEHLFLKEIRSLTKSEVTAMKLGSILAFNSLSVSGRMKDVEKESLDEFLNYLLNLVTDNLFGFICAEVLSNYFKIVSKKQFEKVKSTLKKELMQLDELEKHPQLLLIWLGFSAEQKKSLKTVNKNVPSLENSGIMAKLPSIMKSCKTDHALAIYNRLTVTPVFPAIWKSLMDFCMKSDSDLKVKQMVLSMGFATVNPPKNSAIAQMTIDKRKLLIETIYGNESFVNLLYKQLSSADLDLYEMCSNFVTSLSKIDDTTEKVVLEHVFKCVTTTEKIVTDNEIKTSSNLRLSHNLVRFVNDKDTCQSYVEVLKAYFNKSESDNEKIYVFEELTSLITKTPLSIIEMLLTINGQYNHSDCDASSRVVEAAKALFLRGLETIPINNLDHLKTLLTQAASLCGTTTSIKSTIECVLQYWDTQTPKPTKKRSASERDKVIVDINNVTDVMFMALQSHMCLYMISQPFDQETIDTMQDLKSCFHELKGGANSNEEQHCTKKNKCSQNNGDCENEKNWKLVLTDVLTLFMEQSCHYLRNLSANVFKVLVTEGHVDDKVINLIKSTIADIDVEINGVDKQKKKIEDEKEDDEAMSDDESDKSDESDENDSEEDEEDDEKANAIKARISAALSSMNVDVDSDADDNCPDDDTAMSSDDDSKDNAASNDKKPTLKVKRFTILQLRQYRNRCLDLLDIVILHASKLNIRMAGFLAYLDLLNKNDVDTESHLVKIIATFKSKYQQKEPISCSEIIETIKQLIAAVEKCHQTKHLVTVFSDVMITLLRINKSQMTEIVSEFKPIIENCITDKKNHPIKAVFLSMFDRIPEMGWAFHSEVLNYVGDEQPRLVQYRAFEILRRIIQNPALKNLIKEEEKEKEEEEKKKLMSRTDIRLFVLNLVERLNAVVMALDLATNQKHSSIVIGSLIDCVKLCPEVVATLNDVVSKIKSLSTSTKPKDFKKTISQFVSAIDLAKSIKKD